MPNTPTHALPYPDDEEWLQLGAYAIEQLAKRLDDVMDYGPTVAQIEPAESGSAAPTSAVDFPGTHSLMSGFSYAGGVLTYTGPIRMFMIAAELVVVTVAAGNMTALSDAQLIQNGVSSIAQSLDYVILEEKSADDRQGVAERGVTHRLVTVGLLGPGSTLQVSLSSSPADATVGRTSLRVYPVGPAT